MQEHGIPITYGYIEDTHENFATGNAAGPGDPAHESNLVADNNAFAAFFARMQADGITPQNTLYIFSSDEGDHFAGTRTPSPTGCDGVTTFCMFPTGTIGELQSSVNGLLKEHFSSTSPPTSPGGYQIEEDTAPNFYLTGNPAPNRTPARTLEEDLGQLTIPDPYVPAGSVHFTNYLADKTEENILHMVTADTDRTPTFTDFANPDVYAETNSRCPTANPSYGESATTDACVIINPGYAWDHGDVAPEINTNWVGFVGRGVANVGVDSTTWADETDVRPTLMYLTGLKDDYSHAGRVLFEDLDHGALPPSLANPSARSAFLQLGETYKQLNAGVGAFGMDTLKFATTGLESTSSSTYNNMESTLKSLGSQRDSLASTVESDLENVEFSGGSLSASDANSLNTQAQNLINEAAALN